MILGNRTPCYLYRLTPGTGLALALEGLIKASHPAGVAAAIRFPARRNVQQRHHTQVDERERGGKRKEQESPLDLSEPSLHLADSGGWDSTEDAWELGDAVGGDADGEAMP
eukprot:scaffold10731_cov146-Isochrysis_galbana.AAC.1